MSKNRYYLVFDRDGNFNCLADTWPMAESILDEQGGGFAKGAKTLEEVERFKVEYANKKVQSTGNAKEYEKAMNDFLASGGKDKRAKKILEELARDNVG